MNVIEHFAFYLFTPPAVFDALAQHLPGFRTTQDLAHFRVAGPRLADRLSIPRLTTHCAFLSLWLDLHKQLRQDANDLAKIGVEWPRASHSRTV
jgi:hypothetical protein